MHPHRTVVITATAAPLLLILCSTLLPSAHAQTHDPNSPPLVEPEKPVVPIPEAYPQFNVQQVFPNDSLIEPIRSTFSGTQELAAWTELTPFAILISLSDRMKEIFRTHGKLDHFNGDRWTPPGLLVFAPTAQAWLRFLYRLVVPPIAENYPQLAMPFMQMLSKSPHSESEYKGRPTDHYPTDNPNNGHPSTGSSTNGDTSTDGPTTDGQPMINLSSGTTSSFTGNSTGPHGSSSGYSPPHPPGMQQLFNERVIQEVLRAAMTLIHGVNSSLPLFEDMLGYHLVPGIWPEPKLNGAEEQLSPVPSLVDEKMRPRNMSERAKTINIANYPTNISDPLGQSFARRLYRQIDSQSIVISVIDEVLISYPLDELRQLFNVSAHVDMSKFGMNLAEASAAPMPPSSDQNGGEADAGGSNAEVPPNGNPGSETLSAFMGLLGKLTGGDGEQSNSSNPNPFGGGLPAGISLPSGVTLPSDISLPSGLVLPTDVLPPGFSIPSNYNYSHPPSGMSDGPDAFPGLQGIPFLGNGPQPFFPNVTGVPGALSPHMSTHAGNADPFGGSAARKLPLRPMYPGRSVRHLLAARADMQVFNALIGLASEAVHVFENAARAGLPLHVFAPTDTAFFKLVARQWESFVEIISKNNPGAVEEFAERVRGLWEQLDGMPSLSDVLLYHVVNTSAPLDVLAKTGRLMTMAKNITESIEITPQLRVRDGDSARPEPGHITASHPTLTGFVSVSDRVLVPFNTGFLAVVMAAALEAMVNTTPSSSPTSAARSETSGSCVPAGSRVWVLRDGGGASGRGGLHMGKWVQVEHLRGGDVTAVGDGKTSPVIGFSHRAATSLACFVRITLEDGKRLMISKGHYVYANGRLTAAGAVRRGDAMRVATGPDVSVRRVEKAVWAHGLFAPHTMHGDIVVDGFVVSGYTTEVVPWLAHALLAPARLAVRLGMVNDALGDILRDGGGWLGRWMPKGRLRY